MLLVIVLLVLAVPVGFLLLMALVAQAGSGEAKDPDTALDKAFTGDRVATWQTTIGGLSQDQVVKGADARGYKLTAPAGSNGVLTFERR